MSVSGPEPAGKVQRWPPGAGRTRTSTAPDPRPAADQRLRQRHQRAAKNLNCDGWQWPTSRRSRPCSPPREKSSVRRARVRRASAVRYCSLSSQVSRPRYRRSSSVCCAGAFSCAGASAFFSRCQSAWRSASASARPSPELSALSSACFQLQRSRRHSGSLLLAGARRHQ